MADSPTSRGGSMKRRTMIICIFGIVLALPASCIWACQGWGLPSLDGLRVGMTKPEAVVIVGQPSSEGKRPDGTIWLIITQPQSLVWIDLEFDAKGLLRSFHYERF